MPRKKKERTQRNAENNRVRNRHLGEARDAKIDEFYTQLSDIEKELRHYKKFFQKKVVLCNCDDPYESNFFKYFAMNFNTLGLKKLIATCYSTSPVKHTQLMLFGDEPEETQEDIRKKPYKIEITEVNDNNGDGRIDLSDVEWLLKNDKNVLSVLNGNGDFRSPECIDLLKQADVVVTNPPFSLFREYVAQLIMNNKEFIIIGNQNAITYKEIFPLIKEDKIWIGYKFGDMAFRVPNYFEPRETRYWQDETGQKWRSMGNICWFTNLDIQKRHENMILVKKYTPEKYPKYDNYDAIEVSRKSDIPCDYDGVMGVPVTFLEDYNPEQFEILGITDRQNSSGLRTKKYTLEDAENANDLNARSVLLIDGNYKSVYARILIRKRI